MRQRQVIARGLGLVVIMLSGTALGQEAPPRREPPPLQGPPVKETRAPHVEDQFTDGMKGGRMGPQIPMRAYTAVIGKLRGESAPEGLRLSDDQEQKLGAIEKDFREAASKYGQQRGDSPPRRADRPKDGAPDAKEGDRPRREMAQDMQRNGPRPADYQTRIWAVLNEKQQAYVKVELDKVREDLQKRRSEEMMQRRLDQQKGGKPDAARPDARPDARPEARPDGRPGGPGAEGDARPLRERAQRLMRRLAQLPEEDRERLFRRLEDELDRRGIPDVGDKPPPQDR